MLEEQLGQVTKFHFSIYKVICDNFFLFRFYQTTLIGENITETFELFL